MSPLIESLLLGSGFVLGLAGLGLLAIYLVDRITSRRSRPAPRPRDPYTEAQQLAARRIVGRATVSAKPGGAR